MLNDNLTLFFQHHLSTKKKIPFSRDLFYLFCQITSTFIATGPLSFSFISNSTDWPASSEKTLSFTPERCTNKSLLSSDWIKPNPLTASYHFTVPFIKFLVALAAVISTTTTIAATTATVTTVTTTAAATFTTVTTTTAATFATATAFTCWFWK
jgi:hypothetical protein